MSQRTFWAAAGPLIDLAHTLLLEPLRWVLLATAFHQCLARFAAREGVDGEPASAEHSVRGTAWTGGAGWWAWCAAC